MFLYFRDEGFLYRIPDEITPENMRAMEVWDPGTFAWAPIVDAETQSHAVFFGLMVDIESLEAAMKG